MTSQKMKPSANRSAPGLPACPCLVEGIAHQQKYTLFKATLRPTNSSRLPRDDSHTAIPAPRAVGIRELSSARFCMQNANAHPASKSHLLVLGIRMRTDRDRPTRNRLCASMLVVLFGISATPAQEQPSQKQPVPSTKQQQPLEQKEPTPAKQQSPKTAPQIEEVLPAYEGQNVAAIEVAGRPGLNEQKLASFLVQRQGEPFSVDKIEQSVDALKKSGAAKEIELDIRPEPDGIRVIFVLQPAMYFG